MNFFIKVASKIRIPYKRKVALEEKFFFQSNDLRGALICGFTPWQFSNLFIWGKAKHLEIVTGPTNCVGAVMEGVRETRLENVLEKWSWYVVLMPTRSVEVEKVISFSRSQIGKPYDDNFEKSDVAFYCSELGKDAYNNAGYGLSYKGIVRPQEIVEDSKNFRKVYEVLNV